MENFPLLRLLTGGHVKNNQTHETAMCCMVCRLIEILLAKKNQNLDTLLFGLTTASRRSYFAICGQGMLHAHELRQALVQLMRKTPTRNRI